MITKMVTAVIGTFAVISLSSICLHKSKKQSEDKRRDFLVNLCKEDAEKTLEESREYDKYINISSSTLINSSEEFLTNNFYFSEKKVSFEDIVSNETLNGWKYKVQPTMVTFYYYFWDISMSQKVMVKICFSLSRDEKSLMRSKYEYADVYQCI